MSLEKLKKSLLLEADKESERILTSASEQANAINNSEKNAMLALNEKVEREVKEKIEEERKERLAWARLESKKIIAEAIEDSLKAAMDELYEAFSEMNTSSEYKKFLENSLKLAIAELKGPVKIHLKKGEGKLIKVPKECEVIEDLNEVGGLIAESFDGKVRYNRTIRTIVDYHQDEIRNRIYSALHGGK